MNVKCHHCNEKSDRDTMIKVSNGKLNKYYHNSCYPLYLEQQEKKQIEAQQWDDVYQLILKIHEIEVLPKGFMNLLIEFRNGTMRQNGVVIKKSKQGVNYKYIHDAYLLALPTIKYYRDNKPFENKERELKYCFAIVRDKINDVVELERKKKQSEIVNKRVEKQVVHIDEVQKKNPKDDELDISEFL